MIEKLEKVIALMKQVDFLEDQLSLASELRGRLSRRELIISVIGQFKRGKSSLINALLDDEVLPVGIIPLTTTVTEIRQGNSFRAVVRFVNGAEQEIARSELPDYISEQKNPNNEKNVSAVQLWTELFPFGPDVTLVDTPGVGSIHQHNTQTSNTYIEKSDAVLFLLSVDSPVSEIERDFLLKAREHAAKFYFAVNKIDTITTENLKEFLPYCKAVLSEAIGIDVMLYPVSAKTNEGVSGLAEKLKADFQSSYDALLKESVLIKLDAVIMKAKAKLTLYQKAAMMSTEELEIKISQLKAKQLSLTALSDEAQVLVRIHTDRLVENIKTTLEEILPDTVAAVQTEAKQLYEKLKSLPPKQFELQLVAALDNILHIKIEALNGIGLSMLQDGYEEIVSSLNKKSMDTAHYISELVKESFDIEYPVAAKEYLVSERNDNYIRTTLNNNAHGLVYFLPRDKANAIIFDRLNKAAAEDLEKNKTRIIYNYRYKMQESLRPLCAEFSTDISNMHLELVHLLNHIEHQHMEMNSVRDSTVARLKEIRRQLDCLD